MGRGTGELTALRLSGLAEEEGACSNARIAGRSEAHGCGMPAPLPTLFNLLLPPSTVLLKTSPQGRGGEVQQMAEHRRWRGMPNTALCS